MGQNHSDSAAIAATPEQLSSRLAHRLAEKCFTPLEITHFKDNFTTLCDEQDGLQYWREDTLCRFLQIPDSIGANHILGQMLGYLGAWPFRTLAPAILTRESLCKIISILTRRYEKVLKGGRKDRANLIFKALAVHDRRLSDAKKPELTHDGNLEANIRAAQAENQSVSKGFAVDQPGNDEDDEDDDDMALAALESLDAIEVFSLEKHKLGAETGLRQAQIPFDNFRSLLLLMLLTAPLRNQEDLSTLALHASEDKMDRLHRIADSILWSFAPEKHAGISVSSFRTIVNQSLPFFLEGFNPLFEHFLFSKQLDLSQRRGTSSSTSIASLPPQPPPEVTEPEPILARETDILNSTLLCQISFFIPSPSLFNHLRLLYSGSNDGFSINSFEQKVLNWRAPTLLLVQGTRENQKASSDDTRGNFPYRRFQPGSSGNSTTNRLVFGIYLNTAWKHTHKEPIGDSRSLLFQLEPIHDVLAASTLNQDYVTLTKSGIAAGSPVPRSKPVSGLESSIQLGPVSLNLDESLEYGVFMHDAAGGGAYGTSRAQRGTFEERFEIEHLEVWGCGGDDVAREQQERWQWEEKEAMARRGVTTKGDKEATYQLLEMAGIVGQNRSGGSMG